ncbi:MAG: TonB-dependent receptor [Chlorobi bacterium]|nr:TonB-dependent receptor [Chlorobiota bacterium]
MKKNIAVSYLILLFAFMPAVISGHNIIKGKVLNESTNSPLPGASVRLKGTSEGTTTDEWGNFGMDTDYESGTLIISYIGFKTKEVDFTSHTEFLVIALTPDVIDLSTVRVSATKITPMVSIAQVDVNVRTVNTSQDVLRIVPGLFIAQHAGGGKSEQIFLRGFDADHGTDVNISVDGLPVNMVSQAHGQGYADLHWLIPELIREVDFGKGPYYAERGDFATAGYVAFKTLTILEHNMVKLETGQFNTFRTVDLFNLLGKQARESGKNAYVALEYFMTDGPFEHPQNFSRLNMLARYNQIVDQKNMFTITASMFNSKWDQSGQIPQSAVDNGTITRWGSIDPSEGGNTQRYNLSIKTMHQINNGMLNNLLYYTRYHFDLYSNFTFFLIDSINGDEIRQKENRNLYGYKGSYVKSFSLKKDNVIETLFGGGFRFDEIINSQLLRTKERYIILDTVSFGNIFETNINLYGQATWMINKWMINAGMRLDAFKFEYNDKTTDVYRPSVKYKNIFSPKINVAYNFSGQLQLYAKLGKGFHSNDARVVAKNDSISTLPAAYGADLGITWKPVPRMIINTALWYIYLQEELVWSGDAGTWEPSGRTRRLGVDFSFRWQIIRWIFFDLDINYGQARFVDEPDGANYVPLSPVLTSTGGLTFNHPTGWSASLRYRFMGDRPADETNTVTALGYFICDFKLNYTFRKWTFGLSVQNLFNADWNEAQFAGEYRVTTTSRPDYGLTYTPGTPFFFKGNVIFLF